MRNRSPRLRGVRALAAATVIATGSGLHGAAAAAPAWHVDHVETPGSTSVLTRVAMSGSGGWAVGSQITAAGIGKGLIERYQSTRHDWTSVPVPGGGREGIQLDAVAGTLDQAWAVGNDETPHGIALHWKGGVWSSTAVPKVSGGSLAAVTIISTHDVWAAGSRTEHRESVPWAIHWNGHHWKTETMPNPGTGLPARGKTAFVTDMTRVPNSATLVAVGVANGYGRGSGQMFVEELTGGTWRILHVQSSSGAATDAYGVTAVSATNIWAAGETDDGSSESPVLFHKSGHKWHMLRLPVHGGGALQAVSAKSADSIWAVGASGYDTGRVRPLIEHYDGASWTEQNASTALGTGCTTPILQGVDSTTGASAVTVGYEDCKRGNTAISESRR